MEGNGNEDRREPEHTMARSRTRTSLLGKSAEALFRACLLFGWKKNHMLRCVACECECECECECDTRMTLAPGGAVLTGSSGLRVPAAFTEKPH